MIKHICIATTNKHFLKIKFCVVARIFVCHLNYVHTFFLSFSLAPIRYLHQNLQINENHSFFTFNLCFAKAILNNAFKILCVQNIFFFLVIISVPLTYLFKPQSLRTWKQAGYGNLLSRIGISIH